MMQIILRVSFVFVTSLSIWGKVSLAANKPHSNSEEWLQDQKRISIAKMNQNISPEGSIPGSVAASPSRDSPNYYFHWVRDASLTVNQILVLAETTRGKEQDRYLRQIQDFISLSRQEQQLEAAEGLGEPRYLMTGQVDTIPWSRPQFDGPALRARVLLRYLNFLARNNFEDENIKYKLQAEFVIRADLEFVLKKWKQPSYDIWEELRGMHFYTQSAHYAACIAGAGFFARKADLDFSQQLSSAAQEMKVELDKYWIEEKEYVGASRDLELPKGSEYKNSNLDSAVILAAIHSSEIIANTSDQNHLLMTAQALENAFTQEYKINQGHLTPVIGRFTDDVYFGGNPWYLTTAAFAEFYNRIAISLLESGEIQLNKENYRIFNSILKQQNLKGIPILRDKKLILSTSSRQGRRILLAFAKKADSFLDRIHYYLGSRGDMSEQFDRNSGLPVSAFDLTWSYASFLSAVNARDQLARALTQGTIFRGPLSHQPEVLPVD